MFRTILTWFGGLLLFSFLAFVATSIWLIPRHPAQEPLNQRLHSFQFNESVRIYESGGPNALANWLAVLDRNFPAKHFLVDANGRDVLNGADRSDIVRLANVRPRFFRFPPPAVFAVRRTTADGHYSFLALVQRDFNPLANMTVYAWIVLVIVLLCYVLARKMVKPVRQLHQTVIRFGQGDLKSRTNSDRRDEVGDLARSFDQMADRIQTLLTAERRLLQDVSHELRSPLARLRFAVELAKSKSDAPAEFARVNREIERLTTLVEELVQVTRAEGDPEARNLNLIQLNQFVEGIVNDCSIEAEAKGCTLAFHAPGPLTWKGDQELLHRAIENVLRNAIAYTPEGERIDIELNAGADCVRFSVRDRGPGVPEEELSRIFRPFYRVEEDRRRNGAGGVGLGLAIVQRAVRLHHGEVSARNASPGLIVELKLPH